MTPTTFSEAETEAVDKMLIPSFIPSIGCSGSDSDSIGVGVEATVFKFCSLEEEVIVAIRAISIDSTTASRQSTEIPEGNIETSPPPLPPPLTDTIPPLSLPAVERMYNSFKGDIVAKIDRYKEHDFN